MASMISAFVISNWESYIPSFLSTASSRENIVPSSNISNPSFIEKWWKSKPQVAVLNLCGTIQADMEGGQFFRGKSVNLASLYKPIDKAFKTKDLKEVILLINSPGGSPVQSELIANRIMHLSKTKNIEVVSFVEDMALSGGYWLSCAGKEIYTAENSVTGSIGVIASSFGLDNFIKKYDIERRVHKMGKNKAIMDPFLPESPEHKEIMDRASHRMFVNFTNFVKQQRGSRLQADDDVLFTGEFWVGEDAVQVGLVDGVKSLSDYLYEKYGDDVKVKTINPKSGWGAVFNSGLFAPSIPDMDNLTNTKYRFS